MIDPGVIRAARDHLASGHWVKGTPSDGDGNHCAIGAISERIDYRNKRTVQQREALWAYSDFLGQFVPGGLALSIYNDQPTTTLQDIVTVFDKGLAELGEL